MAKGYHSLPLHEGSLEGEGEIHNARTTKFSRGLTTITFESIVRNWAWLGHLILLSTSMTLFLVSFCVRSGNRSDLAYTELYSSYCMFYLAGLRMLFGPKLTVMVAPVAPIVRYQTVRYNLTPIVEGPFVGYGPEVDKAWDYIANDGQLLSHDLAVSLSRSF